MSTLLGALLGYVLRGTTGSQGFQEMVESTRAVTSSPEFENMVRAARSHVAFMIKDLTETLSRHGDHLADVLTAEQSTAAVAQPADWETWPPPTSRHPRPFSDELEWGKRGQREDDG